MKLRCYSENKTVFLSVFYDLVLRSSSGVSLVNDTTTISVSVYYSNDNESVDFDDSCFTWYKDGDDTVFKTGKSFALNKTDFASDSLTLKCTFKHPDSSYQRSEYITITKASNGYSRAVIQLFKRSASKPANYDGGVLEYTFSTNEISGSTGTWFKTIPSGEHPLYVVYATAFSNASKDSITTGEWTPPAILAEHGTDGSPGPTTFSLVLYQRKASAPSKPTGNVTYNIKSGVLIGAGYWTKEFPNGNDPCWVISATFSTYEEKDTIPPSEWSPVQKLVENGQDGRGINSIVYSYALSTTDNQPADPQFTEGVKTMTSTNKYLWQKEVITYTTGDPKTTIALIGVYGDTGNAGNGISGIAYYYALSTTSTQPSSITSTTLPIMTSTNKYLWQKEVISYTNGTSKTTVALIGVYGDKGDKGEDSKLIRLVADKTSFSLDSNGEPYEGQVITVSVDKQNISASHSFESDEIGVADNTTEFEITPQMMGYEPIELTNLCDLRQTITNRIYTHLPNYFNLTKLNALTSGMTTLEKIEYFCNLVWVANASSVSYTNIKNCYFYANISLENGDGTTWSKEFNTRYATFGYMDTNVLANKTYAMSLLYHKDEILQKYNEGYTTLDQANMSFYFNKTDTTTTAPYSMTLDKSSIYNVSELLKQPKLKAMTDAQLVTWFSTYLAFTDEVDSTWTIGGKATNLVKPHEEEWYASSVGQYGLTVGTSLSSDAIKLAHTVYARAEAKYTTTNQTPSWMALYTADGYGVASSINNPLANTGYMLSTLWRIASDYHTPSAINKVSKVYVGNTGAINGVVTYVKNNPLKLNLTSSGWLAQLSLMGIESNADIKAFLDKYCPFFEGELAFPRLEEINIKVSADSHSDYLTIKASVQPRSLSLTSQPSKIELDAYGHAIEDEFKVEAHTQNIHGNLTWTNDRGLPIKAGKVQTFHASEMGLRPIELYNIVESGLTDDYAVSNSWASNAEWNGFSKPSVSSQKTLIGGHIYYAKVQIEYVSSTLSTLMISACYPLYVHSSVSNRIEISGMEVGDSVIVGNLSKPTENVDSNCSSYFYFSAGFAGQTVNLIINRSIYDITDLIASSPKLQAMTDAELQTWCDTYIPFIGANSTWTIGGKATNLWTGIDIETALSSYCSKISDTEFERPASVVGVAYSRFAPNFLNSATFKVNDYVYSRYNITKNETGYYHLLEGSSSLFSNAGAIGKTGNTSNLGLWTGKRAYMYPFIYWGTTDQYASAPAGILGITDKLFFNLTECGWLAQLSLMGIEGADAVKAWLDANCPFFTGEFEFPSYKDVTWTAEYEELKTNLTISSEIINKIIISSSHKTFSLSSRGVSLTDQTLIFNAALNGIYGTVDWEIYFDDAKYMEHQGQSVSVLVPEFTELSKIVAIAKCGKHISTLEVYGEKIGIAAPKRINNGGVWNTTDNPLPTKTESNEPLIRGDYILATSGNNELVTYTWNGSDWGVVGGQEENYAEIMQGVLDDALASKYTIPSTSAIFVYCKHLIARNAVIENLFANKIKIQSGGSIYGGGYNEKGENASGEAGIYISAEGKLDAVNASFTSADIEGDLKCLNNDGDIILKTQKGSTGKSIPCSTKTRWLCSEYYAGLSSLTPGSYTCTYKGTSCWGFYRPGLSLSGVSVRIMEGTAGGETQGKDDYISYTIPIDMEIEYELPSYRKNYAFCETFIEVDNTLVATSSGGNTKRGIIKVSAGQTITIGTSDSSGGSYGAISVYAYGDGLYINSDSLNSAGGYTPIKFIYNENIYYSFTEKIVIKGISTDSYIKYAATDRWYNELPSGVSSIASSSVIINGTTYSIISANKTTGSISLTASNGASFSLSAPSDSSERATSGWYDISGTLTIATETTGVITNTLIPEGTNTVGTPTVPYSHVYAGGITATGNITANKVYGAVFN